MKKIGLVALFALLLAACDEGSTAFAKSGNGIEAREL